MTSCDTRRLYPVPRLAKPRSVESRRNAVWRWGESRLPRRSGAVRHALTDPDAGVRHAAAHLAGLVRDPQAVEPLMTMLARDEPPLRLKAAEGLGRLGQPRAIPSLRAALRDAAGDRFLEDALIYALIQLDHRDATLALLDDPHPRVRQAGLIALDQMPSGRLTREQVVPLLDTDDPDLQQTALRVMERHPDWSRAVLGLVKMWLDSTKLTDEQRRSLEGALLGFCGDPSVQDMVGDAMEQARTPPPTRWLLLRALARCRLDPLPEPWIAALGKALDHPDQSVRREAVATIKMRRLDRYDDALAAFARRADLPDDLRIAAMEGVAAGGKPRPLDESALTFLMERLTPATEPLIRAAAARAVSVHALDDAQLIRLAGPLGQADPIVTPLLVTAFTRNPDPNPEVARSLLAALNRAPGTACALNGGPRDLVCSRSARGSGPGPTVARVAGVAAQPAGVLPRDTDGRAGQNPGRPRAREGGLLRSQGRLLRLPPRGRQRGSARARPLPDRPVPNPARPAGVDRLPQFEHRAPVPLLRHRHPGRPGHTRHDRP